MNAAWHASQTARSSAPDFLNALRTLGTHYFVEEPAHKRLFVAEMAVESTRNPRIATIYRAVDAFCLESFGSDQT